MVFSLRMHQRYMAINRNLADKRVTASLENDHFVITLYTAVEIFTQLQCNIMHRTCLNKFAYNMHLQNYIVHQTIISFYCFLEIKKRKRFQSIIDAYKVCNIWIISYSISFSFWVQLSLLMIFLTQLPQRSRQTAENSWSGEHSSQLVQPVRPLESWSHHLCSIKACMYSRQHCHTLQSIILFGTRSET